MWLSRAIHGRIRLIYTEHCVRHGAVNRAGARRAGDQVGRRQTCGGTLRVIDTCGDWIAVLARPRSQRGRRGFADFSGVLSRTMDGARPIRPIVKVFLIQINDRPSRRMQPIRAGFSTGRSSPTARPPCNPVPSEEQIESNDVLALHQQHRHAWRSGHSDTRSPRVDQRRCTDARQSTPSTLPHQLL